MSMKRTEFLEMDEDMADTFLLYKLLNGRERCMTGTEEMSARDDYIEKILEKYDNRVDSEWILEKMLTYYNKLGIRELSYMEVAEYYNKYV